MGRWRLERRGVLTVWAVCSRQGALPTWRRHKKKAEDVVCSLGACQPEEVLG